MRKLKLQMQVTIDGFVAGPNGEMDWMIFNWDDGLNKYVTELTVPVDTILLGRKLAQGFIPHWTTAAEAVATPDQFTSKMVETPKVVFTKTLTANHWAHTELAGGDLTDEITKLKAQEGGDIITYGGGNFVSNLIKANLIDEYYLFINPTAIGKGMAIFGDIEGKLGLQLVETKLFDCGVAVTRYIRKPDQ